MKKLLLLALLLLPCRAFASWSVVQTANNAGACSSSPCVVTIPSTGSGHLLVIASISDNAEYSSVTGGGTWVIPVTDFAGGCNDTGDGTTGYLNTAYVLSSTSGVTSVTVTFNTTITFAGIYYWEFADATPFTFDTCKGLDITPTSAATTFPGPTLQLTGIGAHNLIVSEAFNANSVAQTAVTGSYVDDSGGVFQAFHLLNTASGAPYTITAGANMFATAALSITFKEIATGNPGSKQIGPSEILGPSWVH